MLSLPVSPWLEGAQQGVGAPATGHPQTTATMAHSATCRGRPSSTKAAAAVRQYMAKLEGSSAVEAKKRPGTAARSSSRMLPVRGPSCLHAALRSKPPCLMPATHVVQGAEWQAAAATALWEVRQGQTELIESASMER